MFSKFRTAKKNTTRQIDVVVHNNGVSGLKWKTDKNRVFKKGKYTKRGKKKLPYTTKRIYNLKSKTEYAGYKTVSKRTANDKLFISSYSPTERIEGFITIKQSNKYDYVKLWKAATDDFGYYKQLPRYTKVTILGTCKDYYYVSAGGRKGYVKKVNVAYIGFGSFSRSMYRYHSKTVSATLTHPPTNTSYQNIKWSVTKNGSAITNKKIYNSSGYKKLSFFADKPKTVTFEAKYYYSGSRYISRRVSIKIKPITLSVTPTSLKVTRSKKVVVKINETNEIISPKNLKYKLSNKKAVLSTKKEKNKQITTITATGKGSVNLKVYYYDISKSKNIKIDMLKIYASVNRPGKKDLKKAPDMYAHEKSVNQLDRVGNITKNYVLSNNKEMHYLIFHNLISTGTKFGLHNTGQEMLQKFMSGNNSRYINHPALSSAIRNHDKTHRFEDKTFDAFSHVLKQNKNINKFQEYKHISRNPKKKKKTNNKFVNEFENILNGDNPAYNNIYTGLAILVHGMWSSEVYIESYEKVNNSYKVKLHFSFYDHFGLDAKDVTGKHYKIFKNAIANNRGFKSWYVLQHRKEYVGTCNPYIVQIDYSLERYIKK